MNVAIRPELPPVPPRMTGLKIDRGYPVPWFVPWLTDDDKEAPDGEGRPEFRLMSARKLSEALRYGCCWLCGGKLGRHKAFVIGPMCLVNRINAEPPSHRECAEFAVTGCPFLTRPHARRRDHDTIANMGDMAGVGITRNPGATCLYVVEGSFRVKGDGKGGKLIDLPDPSEVLFYFEGRPATRAEVEESVETGLPFLLEVCVNAGEEQEVRDRAAVALQMYAPSE